MKLLLHRTNILYISSESPGLLLFGCEQESVDDLENWRWCHICLTWSVTASPCTGRAALQKRTRQLIRFFLGTGGREGTRWEVFTRDSCPYLPGAGVMAPQLQAHGCSYRAGSSSQHPLGGSQMSLQLQGLRCPLVPSAGTNVCGVQTHTQKHTPIH